MSVWWSWSKGQIFYDRKGISWHTPSTAESFLWKLCVVDMLLCVCLYTNGTVVVAYVIRIMTEKPLLCWVRQKKQKKTAALSVTQLHPQSELSLTDENTVLHSLSCRVTFAYDGVTGNYGPKDGASAVLNVRRRVETGILSCCQSNVNQPPLRVQ